MIKDFRAAAEALYASGFRSDDRDTLMSTYELSPLETEEICRMLELLAGTAEGPYDEDALY